VVRRGPGWRMRILFMGPGGVGKRLFATELARGRLLCEKPAAGRSTPGDGLSRLRANRRPDSHPDLPLRRQACRNRSSFPIDLIARGVWQFSR